MVKKTPGHIRKHGLRYEVSVFAGRDPITGRYLYVRDSAATLDEAEELRSQLLAQVEADTAPTQRATMGLLLEQWLEVAHLAVSTRHAHIGYIDRTILPVLGKVPVRRLRVNTLDRFYAHLARCRELCDGRPFRVHSSGDRHDCATAGCQWHRCSPMAPSTIRRIHSIISTALTYAVKWEWVDRNVAKSASLPRLMSNDADPPAPEQMSKLLKLVWATDEILGLFLWLKVITGARRGELCALRWDDVRWSDSELRICRNYVVRPGYRAIKETKTHQRRWLALDDATMEMLDERWRRCQKLAEQLGGQLGDDAYVFCRDGLGEDPWLPDTVTHQFERLAAKAGVDCRLHDLRHYNATQLIAAGVDLRTVAGRLGHSGGGSMTLRIYSHRVRSADVRAVELLANQLRPPESG
jgi:integrase